MRLVIALLAVFGLLVGSAAVPVMASIESGSALVIDDQQTPSGRVEIDINRNEGGGAWYTSPLWIAIGVIALVLVILLIIVASRGGGTTIVRE